jgi:acyl carrier protein
MKSVIINEEILSSWFREKLSEETGVRESDIRLDASVESFSLDSLSLVTLSHDLETLIDRSLDPTVFWQFPTVNDLIKWLLEQER